MSGKNPYELRRSFFKINLTFIQLEYNFITGFYPQKQTDVTGNGYLTFLSDLWHNKHLVKNITFLKVVVNAKEPI